MPATMTNTGNNSAQSRSAMRGANAENFSMNFNGRSMRPPLRMIYIHSVAKKGFTIRTLLFPKLELRGCEAGERSVLCAPIPDPVPQSSPDQERGGSRIDEEDGMKAVIDMLCPGNFTYDLYAGSGNPSWYENRNGTNLAAEGLFLSLSDPPTEEEIRKAEDCRDKHYRAQTKEALKLAAKSTKDLNEWLDRYPDTHIAMDALGISAPWHTLNVVKVVCPNCGEDIKQGVAFHVSNGKDCILDWKRAYEVGRIKKDEVPPSQRWQGFGKITEASAG